MQRLRRPPLLRNIPCQSLSFKHLSPHYSSPPPPLPFPTQLICSPYFLPSQLSTCFNSSLKELIIFFALLPPQANGIGKRCRKATAADSCPAFYPPTLGPKPDDLGPGGGGSNPGDGGSPGDGHGSSSPKDGLLPGDDGFSPHDDPPNPDNKPGNDDDGEDGPWRPKRPPGLWKAKKVRRRDCNGAGAGVGLPLMSKSSSFLSEDEDGNEHVVAAMADNTEEGDPVVAAAMGKGYEDIMGGDSAFLESPGQGSIHDSSLDLDLAASGLEGEDFFKQTPAEDK